MSNVIPFPATRGKGHLTLVEQVAPGPLAAANCSPESGAEEKPERMRAIEEELARFMGPDALAASSPVPHDCPEEACEWTAEDIAALQELVVFSPEVQRDEFSGAVMQEPPRPVCWGDVFVKTGNEYPFLFTVYTREYVRDQLLCFGETIDPSPRDVILNRKQLLRADIVRAVIKWMNKHCEEAVGKPILLEDSEVLKTLVCEAPEEVHCPDSAL